jgi:hypothetical protein
LVELVRKPGKKVRGGQCRLPLGFTGTNLGYGAVVEEGGRRR